MSREFTTDPVLIAAANESGLWQELEANPVLRDIYMCKLIKRSWGGERSATERRYCSLVWNARQTAPPEDLELC